VGSISTLFDMSRGALVADQAALNATANNVANQNTAGYTDQVVSFQATDTVTLNGTQFAGAPTTTTTSTRDRVLEQRVQQQMQLQSASSAESDAMTQIQNAFGVTGSGTSAGSTQLGTALNSFFGSLTALAGNPADAATQQGVLSAANVLASTFNSAAAQLTSVQTTLNSNLSSSVTAVNALTKTIAGLNQQISSTSPNGDAGTLEDQRQLAIEQLSQYVGLDQITTQGNGITLTTQGGSVLVQGSTASALSAVTIQGGQYTTAPTTEILDSSGNNISAGIHGGSIGGQLTAQNVDLPAAVLSLNNLTMQVGVAVNTQNAAGLTTTGAPGGAIFSWPGSPAAGIFVGVSNPSAIASAAAGQGESGNGNADALANLSQVTNSSGQTMSGSLSVMLAQVGASASSLAEQTTTQQASLTQLTTQRDSLSAVSLDTEAANLSQYQKSYQAAAQLLTVLDSLMATAINLGQQTTVS